jgi:hypothetical protein
MVPAGGRKLTHRLFCTSTVSEPGTSALFSLSLNNLSFVYTQKSTTAEETVQAKEAFERYAKAHGVTVHHYHADNGIFAEAEFLKSIEKSNQTISFCRVNAHHMNGHAEKRIRDLQENARAMLLHAKRRWPSAATANLWPYAVRMANEVHNFSPGIKNDSRRCRWLQK